MADLFTEPLASRRNPRVRAVLELASEPAARRRHGVYLLEGVKLVREAMFERHPLAEVFVSPRLQREQEGAELLAALTRAGAPLTPVTDALMGEMAPTRTPQGVLAVAPLPPPAALPVPRTGRPLLVAWHVQDPGNLGALLRTVEATGAAGLVCAGGGADPWHPRAVRAAAGSLLRLRPAVLAQETVLAQLQAAGYRLAAAVPRDGDPCDRFPWGGPWALLLGGEGGGLPDHLLKAAERRVSVPTEGRVESLSVPAAAAMLLYESMRRRLTPPAHRRSAPPSSRRRPPRRRPGEG